MEKKKKNCSHIYITNVSDYIYIENNFPHAKKIPLACKVCLIIFRSG